MLSFFSRDVLDEILDLTESVSGNFPTYYCHKWQNNLLFDHSVIIVFDQNTDLSIAINGKKNLLFDYSVIIVFDQSTDLGIAIYSKIICCLTTVLLLCLTKVLTWVLQYMPK